MKIGIVWANLRDLGQAHGAPDRIAIPMMGMAQSFNVSVSAGIILAEAFRQRSAAGMYDDPLEEMDAAREVLWNEWTQREIRRELRQDR